MESAPLAHHFEGIVFDKDGTLLDFQETWNPAIYEAIQHVTGNDERRRDAIANALGFCLETKRTKSKAPILELDNHTLSRLISPWTNGADLIGLCCELSMKTLSEARGATSVLRTLQSRRIPSALCTNDYEKIAKKQVEAFRWSSLIQPVLGCDSGYGEKPGPGMLLEAVRVMGVEPAKCAMVGDCKGDLVAARRAGFRAAIMVGPADAEEVIEACETGLADFWIENLEGLLLPPKALPVNRKTKKMMKRGGVISDPQDVSATTPTAAHVATDRSAAATTTVATMTETAA